MVLFALIAAHHLNIWGLVALTAFQGAVVAFNQPARLALVPSLVAESDLGFALAINSVIFNVARFIGPMVAGLVIVWSGVAASFAANAASYVVFLLALWWVRIDDTAAKASKRREFSTDFKEGIRYTATHPVIGSLLLLLTAIGIGGRPLTNSFPDLRHKSSTLERAPFQYWLRPQALVPYWGEYGWATAPSLRSSRPSP